VLSRPVTPARTGDLEKPEETGLPLSTNWREGTFVPGEKAWVNGIVLPPQAVTVGTMQPMGWFCKTLLGYMLK